MIVAINFSLSPLPPPLSAQRKKERKKERKGKSIFKSTKT